MQDEEFKGVLIALVGFSLLSVGDAVVKSMAGQWSPMAIAALRFVIGSVALSGILWRVEGATAFRPQRPWLQLARGACLAITSLFFFSAVFVMPLAAATALVFVGPILIALLSGPLLGEKVRPATYVASIIALAGVLVVLRPNLAEVGILAFLPLGAALFFALMVIANRAAAGQGSVLSMQVFIAGCAAPILICAALIGRSSELEMLQFGWPEWHVVARAALVALTASSAHYLVFLATTKAGASTVAPMTYVQLLVAVLLGWWWFGEVPDLVTLAGGLIIVAAGLYLWADAKAARRIDAAGN